MGGIGVEGFSWLPVDCQSVASRWLVGSQSARRVGEVSESRNCSKKEWKSRVQGV
jgi:hypothetical protein